MTTELRFTEGTLFSVGADLIAFGYHIHRGIQKDGELIFLVSLGD